MTRRVSIFGATGSIGQNTIDLLVRAPEAYEVVALSGAGNIAQLAQDAIRLRAQVAVTAREDLLDDLRDALSGSGVEAAAGPAALTEAAARPADWVMSAIVGAAGLPPGLAALEQGATLALANKESMVCAGALMRDTAQKAGATLLPVDSEHSAVFQALAGENINRVERIVITASGGAFRDWPLERVARATVAEAQTHPTWTMGQRITIDSASMFNKALEVIEAHELFGVSSDKIEVLVHPQSLVHALVGFTDGGIMAHIGPHDMRHAIGYALHWPARGDVPVERLDLARIGQLEFSDPDPARYPALRLARLVMERGGLAGAVFNAAKERALDAFIAGQIGFLHMAEVVEEVMALAFPDSELMDAPMTFETVLTADATARRLAQQVMTERAG